MEKCAKCGCTVIVQRAIVQAYEPGCTEGWLTVRVDADPSALVFKKSTVKRARLGLLHCGYVEMYADDPGDLYQASLSAQQHTSD